eukprot:746545-Hanusia_phi.AAC.3
MASTSKAPVLVAWGTSDKYLSTDEASSWAEETGKTFKAVQGSAGFQVQMDYPESVYDAVSRRCNRGEYSDASSPLLPLPPPFFLFFAPLPTPHSLLSPHLQIRGFIYSASSSPPPAAAASLPAGWQVEPSAT